MSNHRRSCLAAQHTATENSVPLTLTPHPPPTTHRHPPPSATHYPASPTTIHLDIPYVLSFISSL
ncbi:hypothetical protein J6590_076248 [Homalodisca vitripennis]|nr:hypothetical protein J6590_076248 [Homalodisca vitripennis]